MARKEEIMNAIDVIIPISSPNNGRTYEQALMATGFEAGAKWADEHINLERLWHDASEEEPKKEEVILVEVINTLTPNSEIGYYVEYVSEWLLDSMKTEGFKCRWAYISDLLPKGGEK